VLRKLVLIYVWKKHKDPGIVQAKIDFWFILFVVIPELGFYIYGNCIIYKPTQEQCRNTEPFDSLWYCSLIVIIYGYFYMLLALLFILFYCFVFLLYRAWSNEQVQEEQEGMENMFKLVPMLDNF
jgi:cbb3-type cytochrome oxidase subunit 3